MEGNFLGMSAPPPGQQSPIRVVHFSDLHIGMENYGRLDPGTGTSTRVRDFLDRLDEVVEFALEEEADLAIFAGDAFKSRDPDPTQQREFAKRVKRLADALPTLLVVGNHDMPGMAAKASSVDIFHALDVPGVILGQKPNGKVVETRRGPVFLAWMPYPMRNRLLIKEEHQGKTIGQLETSLREVVSTILLDLTQRAAEHDMPRVLCGHFSVDLARVGSERTVMLGKDVTVLKSTLTDPTWDYVALGHIHKHQNLNEDGYPPVVYSGSLERIDFSEEEEAKGFCWVMLARGETQWEFIPVNARPFQTVRVDVRQEEDPTGSVLSALEEISTDDSIVRVIVQLQNQQQASLREREIENALDSAMSVTVSRDVEHEIRSRLGEDSPEALTPLQLLEHYFQSMQETPERTHSLLAKAEELLRDTN
jgi:exonuclease SbcD